MITPPRGPPDSFHLFPRLQQELRNRIWMFAASSPRRVKIQSFPPGSVEIQYFFTSEPTPVILQTCQESCSEALAFYTRSFSTGSTQRYIWINFDADTIQIQDYCLSKVQQAERSRIRSLRVEAADSELFVWYYYPWDYEMMSELRQLVILSTPEVSQWGHLIDTITRDFEQCFGGLEGWKGPEIRFVEAGTGVELNIRNFEAMSTRGGGEDQVQAALEVGTGMKGEGVPHARKRGLCTHVC